VTTTTPNNAEIAGRFELLADLLELDGAVAYRYLAYRKAAKTLRETPESVARLSEQGRLRELPGVGAAVSDKVADVGEYISPSAPNTKVATIVRTSTLRMRIDIPEASIGKVGTGQGISLQTSAYPDRNFAGTIVRISPSLNQTARTLTVEAEIQNVDGLLKPGQFATVRITQSKPEPAVMVLDETAVMEAAVLVLSSCGTTKGPRSR